MEDGLRKPHGGDELEGRNEPTTESEGAPRERLAKLSEASQSLDVDTALRRVTLAGKPVDLTATEYALLYELSVHGPRTLTHTVLRNVVNRLRKPGDDAEAPGTSSRSRASAGGGGWGRVGKGTEKPWNGLVDSGALPLLSSQVEDEAAVLDLNGQAMAFQQALTYRMGSVGRMDTHVPQFPIPEQGGSSDVEAATDSSPSRRRSRRSRPRRPAATPIPPRRRPRWPRTSPRRAGPGRSRRSSRGRSGPRSSRPGPL